MTSMGKTEKAKITQLHGPFNESLTSEKPQKAKLVILLKQKAKTIGKYYVSTINRTLKLLEGPVDKKQ